MKFKNNKLKIGFFITIIIVLILGLLKFGGIMNILFIGTEYNVGDTVSFTACSSSGSNIYSGCRIDTFFDGTLLEYGVVPTMMGGTECYNTKGYKLTINDVGTKSVGVTYRGCTGKNNIGLLTPGGFSEFKSIKVINPVTLNCPINQIPNSGNTACIAAPCKYTDLTTKCVNGNLVKYSCYNTDTNFCTGSSVCDLSKSTSSCYTPPVTTKTCYKCDGETLMQETVTSCSSGFSTSKPICTTLTKTCYKCEAGQILTETVTSCSSGYSTTQPTSCTIPPPPPVEKTCYSLNDKTCISKKTTTILGEDVATFKCETGWSESCTPTEKVCPDGSMSTNMVCKTVEKSLWQKIVEWFQNLFKVN